MQKIEKRKQNLNDLVSNYRPIGPRHLLAAALMLRAGKVADEAAKKPARKIAAA
ncbi:hypothetical protein IHQ71_08380 [Rhizobium sp. TH2]|uniref:hypothetical protein n=1 Tax=Rhizobium sp. TH2 TaxID=2775403 RepID=UPI0021580F08|nr:hypothetical protein [Rhizobium sp. TH2]UVC10587.1 hypothetical protein IHQ71_08380 [Rhizobium sp. TH2]